MRYYVLATDYDGTLARDGRVDEDTVRALERLRSTGRKVILVSGRELDDLERVFDRMDLFDYAVLENGALLYHPQDRVSRYLAEPPSEEFVEELRRRGVDPISVGRIIVATWRPHEVTVLETIRDMGLELEIIFNKDAVMVLPSGINKTVGLRLALDEMLISGHNVAGIGDAENDEAFLSLCESSAAVANSIPALHERVDLVTDADHGAGVAEYIGRIIDSDLEDIGFRMDRHDIPFGVRRDGTEYRVIPYGPNILLAGASGSGKSTLAIAFLEHLAGEAYQFCIFDPEGDYHDFRQAVPLGGADHHPNTDEVTALLRMPGSNCSVSMVGVSIEDRPPFFREMLNSILDLRTGLGHPHWIVLDEAHHLFPSSWAPGLLTLPEHLGGMLYITVHPEHVSRVILQTVGLLLVVGDEPAEVVREFCRETGRTAPDMDESPLETNEVLAWDISGDKPPERFKSYLPSQEYGRHRVKYARGELDREESFWFRGPEGTLRLRADNLVRFVQLAEGVDEKTWMYHLRRGDYSKWFRETIRDPELADETARIEQASGISAEDSRTQVRKLIEERYTAPA